LWGAQSFGQTFPRGGVRGGGGGGGGLMGICT